MIPMTQVSTRVEKPNNAVQDLVPVSKGNNLAVATESGQTTTAISDFLAVPTKKKTITVDDAREVAKAAVSLKTCLAELGETCDITYALEWASKQQKANNKEHASLEKERRGYIYDGFQRNTDRINEERRHHENLTAGREDKDWLSKLQSARDKTLKALVNAILYCFLAALTINLIETLMEISQLWQQTSYEELMCGRVQVKAPVAIDWEASTLTIFHAVYNLISSQLATTVDCLFFSAGQYPYYGAALVVILGGPWVLDRVLLLPESLKGAATPLFLIIFLCYDKWIDALQLKRLGLCMVLMALPALFGLNYQYLTFSRSFKSGGIPSVAQVNESIEWFDNAAIFLRMTPIVGGLVWGLMVMFRGSL